MNSVPLIIAQTNLAQSFSRNHALRWFRIEDYFLVSYLIWIGSPTFLLPDPKLYVGPIPFDYWILSVVITLQFSRTISTGFSNSISWLLLVPFFPMLFYGIFEQYGTKWITIDFFCYMALVVGVWYSSSKTPAQLTQVLWFTFQVYLILFAVNILLLNLWSSGYTAENTLPVAAISNFVSLVAPYLWIQAVTSSKHQFRRTQWIIISGLLLTSLPAAFLFAWRTAFVQGILSIIMVCYLAFRLGSRAKLLMFAMFSLIILLVASILLGGSLLEPVVGSELIKKQEYQQGKGEERYYEIVHLLEGIDERDQWLTGMGLGSRYMSYWTDIPSAERSMLSWAPHLGAFGFLQKGGIIFYCLLVVMPLLKSIQVLMAFNNSSSYNIGGWAGVLLFLVFSSATTGGWSGRDLLLYGILLSQALLITEKPVHTGLSRI